MFSSGQIFSFNPVQGAEISALDWAVSKKRITLRLSANYCVQNIKKVVSPRIASSK